MHLTELHRLIWYRLIDVSELEVDALTHLELLALLLLDKPIGVSLPQMLHERLNRFRSPPEFGAVPANYHAVFLLLLQACVGLAGHSLLSGGSVGREWERRRDHFCYIWSPLIRRIRPPGLVPSFEVLKHRL